MNDDQSGSFVRGDLFQKCCDHIFWSNAQPRANRNIRAGDVVFCKIDNVLRLFEVLRLTRKRIVLVTGEGDLPCDSFRQQFLPTNVIRWFATNVTHLHPKVTAVPLGLGILQDHVTLNSAMVAAAKKEVTSKDQWLYVNFRPATNPSVRQKIYDSFQALAQHEKWVTFQSPQLHHDRSEFAKQLVRHQFVLAPPGNGVDTHRLWEALIAGTYPIVLKSLAMEPFRALPILMVDSFEEINLDFLKANLKLLEEKKKNISMMQMHFWKEKIEASKISLQGREKIKWKEWFCESVSYAWRMIQRRWKK